MSELRQRIQDEVGNIRRGVDLAREMVERMPDAPPAGKAKVLQSAIDQEQIADRLDAALNETVEEEAPE